MKKAPILVFIIFCSVVFADNIKIGYYQNPPRIYKDENNKPAGFFADITEEILKGSDFEAEWIYMDWTECLENLENGKLDVVVDICYTEERDKKYLFPKETAFISWTNIYTQKNHKVSDIYELNNKKIGVLKDSYYFTSKDGIIDLTNQFGIKCEFIEYPDYQSVFKDLEDGKIFAGIANKDIGSYFETIFNISRSSIVFQPTKVQYAFSYNSPNAYNLANLFDTQLLKLKQNNNSIYYKSLKKYFDVYYQSVYPAWINYALLVIIASLLIALLFIKILRHQVAIKVKEIHLSDKLWEKTFNAINDNIWILDKDYRIIRANKTSNAGINPSSNNIINEYCYKAFHNRDKPLDNCPFTLSKISLKREVLELDHQNRYLRVIIDPIFDDDGNYGGAVHIIQDISKLKKTMQDLITANQQLKKREQDLLDFNEELTAHEQELSAINQQLSANEMKLVETNQILNKKNAENNKMNKALQEELKTKKLLLSEIFHRTKNNMQIITSMLAYEMRRNPKIKRSFSSIQNKIYSLSLVQTQLYRSGNLSNLNFKNFILGFNKFISNQFKDINVHFHLEIDDLYLLIDTAQPLSLVYNEILSNIFEHAFPQKKEGNVFITLTKIDNEIVLDIKDDGIGIKTEHNLEDYTNIGMQTIFSIIKIQLNGKIEYKNDNGLQWHIMFKDNQHQERV